MIIQKWLKDSAELLANTGISSALLDAEIILAHTIKKSRIWLHAHSDKEIPDYLQEIANMRLDLRVNRTPIAYIIGHKEFYGRLFNVTPSVLVPRPESESIINLIKLYSTPNHKNLIDVGTGSGILGITAKLELPKLKVLLTDINRYALNVAIKNAELLNAKVSTRKSDLLLNVPGLFDIILANLPYVDKNWQRSPETNYEPPEALFAEDGGLKLIFKLIKQSKTCLNDNGLIILEADPEQHAKIIDFAKTYNLKHIKTDGYALLLQKINLY